MCNTIAKPATESFYELHYQNLFSNKKQQDQETKGSVPNAPCVIQSALEGLVFDS